MKSPFSGKKVSAARPTTSGSRWVVAAVAIIAVVVVVAFYTWVLTSLRGGNNVKLPQIFPLKCPKCESSCEGDYDTALDTISDNPPPIVPSHHAQVFGIEPFERADLSPFDLHVVPTDEWYDKTKRMTDRCDLELTEQTPGARNGLADEIVWVSGLFDLKRGEAGNADFKRPMEEYYRRFQNVLNRGFKMVIYIPPQFEPHLTIDRSRVYVVHMNATDLHTYFPYWERLQAIRTSKLWNDQAVRTGWLSNAPQARLPEYNPLVMSKIYLTRDAARLNPWGVRYHLWMDAGHLCAGEQNPTPEGTSMYRTHMAEGFFATHWPYGTTTEVHGFTDKAMHMYMATAEDPLRIVRGGIFGGTLPYIECVANAYTVVLHRTLSDGYVGTEECIWAIIHTRFPHLFKSFDNNSLGGWGDNCASFTRSKQVEKAIAAGSEAVFKSPAVPKYPSWWTPTQKQEFERTQTSSSAATTSAGGGGGDAVAGGGKALRQAAAGARHVSLAAASGASGGHTATASGEMSKQLTLHDMIGLVRVGGVKVADNAA